jgi:hypothetical protein
VSMVESVMPCRGLRVWGVDMGQAKCVEAEHNLVRGAAGQTPT